MRPETVTLGAAVDGPGSLLNYQGHPLDRLTPDRDVTNPSTDAKENGSHHNPGRTASPPKLIRAIRRCIRR